MPMRWSPLGAKGRESRLGANITDGMIRGYDNGGGLARVREDAWESRREFKTQRGWIYQDLRKPDTNIEPYLGSGPQYSWNNKIATVYKSLHTGDKFLPVPGEYALSPGEVPRNGNVPGFYLEGDIVSVGANRQYTQQSVVTNPPPATNPVRPFSFGVPDVPARKKPSYKGIPDVPAKKQPSYKGVPDVARKQPSWGIPDRRMMP